MDGWRHGAAREFFNWKLQIYAHKPCFASVFSLASPEAKTFVPSSLLNEPLSFPIGEEFALFHHISSVRLQPLVFLARFGRGDGWPLSLSTSPVPLHRLPTKWKGRPTKAEGQASEIRPPRRLRAKKARVEVAFPPSFLPSFLLSTFRGCRECALSFRSLYILRCFCSFAVETGGTFCTAPPPIRGGSGYAAKQIWLKAYYQTLATA